MAPVPVRLISAELASTLSGLCTLIYVAVLYLHPSARPTRRITKDHPSVIKSRITLVTLASLLTACVTVYIGKPEHDSWPSAAVRILGLRFNLRNVLSSLALTCMLFAGPLFEYFVADGGLTSVHRDVASTISSWVGIRNFVAGPMSEEFVFRSCIIPLHVFAGLPIGRIVLLTPLYFGLAHVHHIYERCISRSGDFVSASLISLVQFIYTTIFGWFAAYLFIRTGSVWSAFFVHSFCNSMGLPRVTGRVNGSLLYSFVYYTLLIGGALAFAANIESWTDSASAYQPYSFI